MLNLSPRLKAAAEFACPDKKTVDVGTDHAYLPAFLVLSGKKNKVLACDIGEKPLNNAAKTLELYNLKNSIELRQSDGLSAVSPEEAEEIIICGMGGTLIRDILTASPWVKSAGRHLILQPMTHSEDVRRYLCENGFTVKNEICLTDSGRVYCCISAVHTGQNDVFSPGYWYFGNQLNVGGEAAVYVKKQLDRVKTRLNALKNAGRFPLEQQVLACVVAYYESRVSHDCK